MIKDWVSGSHFFIPLSFPPGAFAKGNFLSLCDMCETEVGGQSGAESSALISIFFLSLRRCRHRHTAAHPLPLEEWQPDWVEIKEREAERGSRDR